MSALNWFLIFMATIPKRRVSPVASQIIDFKRFPENICIFAQHKLSNGELRHYGKVLFEIFWTTKLFSARHFHDRS